jgi:hypothetical protein
MIMGIGILSLEFCLVRFEKLQQTMKDRELDGL